MADDRPTEPPRFAGFWRRLFAFVIDMVVLAGVGWALGALMFETLAQLGAWGRLVGFVVAGIYFGLQEGTLGGGQTLGKRVVGIRVLDLAGQPLSVGCASARYAIFGVPYFLNNAMLPPSLLVSEPAGMMLTLLVFGVGGAIFWLLVFNRPSRRSLHDIAIGAIVVHARETAVPRVPPMWRGHVVAVALLLGASIVAPFVLQRMMLHGPFEGMLALQSTIAAQPGVRYASVRDLTASRFGSQGPSIERSLVVTATIDGDPHDVGAQPERLAALVLKAYPGAATANWIVIAFAHGFDIGIATGYVSGGFRYTPAQWLDRIAGGAQG